MIHPAKHSHLIGIAAALLGCGTAVAEVHTEQALKHADDAAQSVGDSQAIRQHAAEALKHLDKAKAENAGNTDVLQHLERSEAELNEAVTHARHFNSPSAADTAAGAKAHLENAQNAAGAKVR